MNKRYLTIGILIILALCAALLYGFVRVAHSPKMAQYNNSHCSYYILNKHWQDAIDVCSKSISNHDQYATGSYIRRAVAYRALGKVKEADADAMKGSERLLLALADANNRDKETIEPSPPEEKPSNPLVTELIEKAEMQTTTDPKKAEESLQAAEKLDPKYPYIYRAWGELYTWQQDWHNAEKEDEQWASVAPKSSKPFSALGYLKYLEGDAAGANDYFGKAKALQPGNLNLVTYRCDNFVRLSQWKNAVDECTEALALNAARRPGVSEKRKALGLDDKSRWYVDEEDYFLTVRRSVAYRALGQTEKADKDASAADGLYVQWSGQ